MHELPLAIYGAGVYAVMTWRENVAEAK